MIEIENTLVSDDLGEKSFVCDLTKCKGACCVEGDLGAPLEKEELPVFREIFNEVVPYMSEEGVKAVEEQGLYVMDWEDDYSTPTINGKECAYAVYDDKGMLKCAIEDAYNDGRIDYKKPISCHLYPIRLSKVGQYTALNYDKWEICADACTLGEKLQVKVYSFLKDPIIRKFGEDYYKKLEEGFKK